MAGQPAYRGRLGEAGSITSNGADVEARIVLELRVLQASEHRPSPDETDLENDVTAQNKNAPIPRPVCTTVMVNSNEICVGILVLGTRDSGVQVQSFRIYTP